MTMPNRWSESQTATPNRQPYPLDKGLLIDGTKALPVTEENRQAIKELVDGFPEDMQKRVEAAQAHAKMLAGLDDGGLPGNEMPLKDAMTGLVSLVVVCEAVEAPRLQQSLGGAVNAMQTFRILERIHGEAKAGTEISVHYGYADPGIIEGDRAIRAGERVIWIIQHQIFLYGDRGTKALPVTEENRQAIKKLADGFPEDMQKRVEAAQAETRLRGRLTGVQPQGWSGGTTSWGEVEPVHWEAGKGMRWEWGTPDDKPAGSVVLWVMEAGYAGKPDGEAARQAQTKPATEIAIWRGRRVFLWSSDDQWPTARADILAVLKATDAPRGERVLHAERVPGLVVHGPDEKPEEDLSEAIESLWQAVDRRSPPGLTLSVAMPSEPMLIKPKGYPQANHSIEFRWSPTRSDRDATVILSIMKPGYDGAAIIGEHDRAELIGAWRGRRVFLWSSDGQWPTARADILVVLKATDAPRGVACLAADENSVAVDAVKLPATVSIDWTVIDDAFFLEVKNGTAEPFMLDNIFIEGFNVVITGLDDRFKEVYTTEGGSRIDRGLIEIIEIKPGHFHRVPFRIEHLPKVVPEAVRYIKLNWTRNPDGDKLPKGGLTTSIYELRKNPDKAAQ